MINQGKWRKHSCFWQVHSNTGCNKMKSATSVQPHRWYYLKKYIFCQLLCMSFPWVRVSQRFLEHLVVKWQPKVFLFKIIHAIFNTSEKILLSVKLWPLYSRAEHLASLSGVSGNIALGKRFLTEIFWPSFLLWKEIRQASLTEKRKKKKSKLSWRRWKKVLIQPMAQQHRPRKLNPRAAGLGSRKFLVLLIVTQFQFL